MRQLARPVVIEVNPRLAGSPDPQMVKLASGIDLVAEHIKLTTGGDVDLRKSRSQTVAVQYLVPDRDGIIDWIEGGNLAADVPGVAEVKFYVKSKTSIVRKGDYRDCIGHVIAASPTLEQSRSIVRHAIDLIHCP